MKLEFEIEYKSDTTEAYVFARLINSNQNFEVAENSKLREYEIEKHIGMPRAIDKNGKQRMDLYAFHLKNKSDIKHFKTGQIIELIQ